VLVPRAQGSVAGAGVDASEAPLPLLPLTVAQLRGRHVSCAVRRLVALAAAPLHLDAGGVATRGCSPGVHSRARRLRQAVRLGQTRGMVASWHVWSGLSHVSLQR